MKFRLCVCLSVCVSVCLSVIGRGFRYGVGEPPQVLPGGVVGPGEQEKVTRNNCTRQQVGHRRHRRRLGDLAWPVMVGLR